jgi:hypothetical protein
MMPPIERGPATNRASVSVTSVVGSWRGPDHSACLHFGNVAEHSLNAPSPSHDRLCHAAQRPPDETSPHFREVQRLCCDRYLPCTVPTVQLPARDNTPLSELFRESHEMVRRVFAESFMTRSASRPRSYRECETHAPMSWESEPPAKLAHTPLPKSSSATLSPRICRISTLHVWSPNPYSSYDYGICASRLRLTNLEEAILKPHQAQSLCAEDSPWLPNSRLVTRSIKRSAITKERS